MSLKRSSIAWVPALAYMLAIFWLSAQSKLPHPPGLLGFDKFQHFLAYAGLGLIIYRAVYRVPILKWNPYTQAFLLAALYGASDEFHQHFVPGRTMDVMDWFADMTGVALGLAGLWMIKELSSKLGRRDRGTRRA